MIKIKFKDHSFVKIEAEDSVIFEMRDYFSFEQPGYQFNPKFKYGGWDGKIRMLDYNGNLPYGLYKYAVKFAEQMGYPYELDSELIPTFEYKDDYLSSWIETQEIYSGSTKITPHWYQKDSFIHGIKNKRGVLNLPTSAGKSLIQALLTKFFLEHFNESVLILVPTTSLTLQMKDDFIDYRLISDNEIHIVGGGKKAKDQTNERIVISTWQSAIKQPKEWFSQFGMLINDEAHLSTGKSLSTINQNMTNCEFKIGLTGSLRDAKANTMQYLGLFGEIFKPVTTRQLMDDGQVTDLKIISIYLRYPEILVNKVKTLDYQKEISLITKYKARNNWVCNLSKKLADKNENVFVMFRFTEHGKSMKEYLESIHDKVFYIDGTISTQERDELKNKLETITGAIVVASYGVFSTGISIKNLHHVIFAHPIKGKITVIQSIGRILRKHKSKSVAKLWDITDDIGVKTKSATAKKKYSYMNYALKHSIERLKRYVDEKFDFMIKTVEL